MGNVVVDMEAGPPALRFQARVLYRGSFSLEGFQVRVKEIQSHGQIPTRRAHGCR